MHSAWRCERAAAKNGAMNTNLTAEEALDEFRAAGALLEGHFVLSSGLHSPVFLQKMFVFQDPARTERLCRALAAKAREAFGDIDVVVSPAVGGIVPGYETARWLGAKAVFVERENGVFSLRRGFTIAPGARALLVEDIITTGLSSRSPCRHGRAWTRQSRPRVRGRRPWRPGARRTLRGGEAAGSQESRQMRRFSSVGRATVL